MYFVVIIKGHSFQVFSFSDQTHSHLGLSSLFINGTRACWQAIPHHCLCWSCRLCDTSLFTSYCHMRLVWKIGDICWSFSSSGNLRVTIKASLWASTTQYRLIYCGTSFLALPFGRFRFCIDKYTWSSTAYMSLSWYFLLAWNAWITWCSMIHHVCSSGPIKPVEWIMTLLWRECLYWLEGQSLAYRCGSVLQTLSWHWYCYLKQPWPLGISLSSPSGHPWWLILGLVDQAVHLLTCSISWQMEWGWPEEFWPHESLQFMQKIGVNFESLSEMIGYWMKEI